MDIRKLVNISSIDDSDMDNRYDNLNNDFINRKSNSISHLLNV